MIRGKLLAVSLFLPLPGLVGGLEGGKILRQALPGLRRKLIRIFYARTNTLFLK
jgi:hypothetical protein